jgi:hypothetical protein
MFASPAETLARLESAGYFTDLRVATAVFLAGSIHRPILLEGPAGAGKTQLAISVAAAMGTHVERLQCYRGVTEDKAIGRFDESLQRLYMEFSKAQHDSWQGVQANLKGRDFFRPGPLMRALECEKPCVLLVDELDKVDEGFEAMLLEILSVWTLSIPEFGTVTARSIPFVVLTSNEERRLGKTKDYDALVEVLADGRPRAFAIEFERTLKGAGRYEELRRILDSDEVADRVLYLTPNREILYVMAFEMRDLGKKIGFALSRAFQAELLDASILINSPANEVLSMRDFLAD